MPLHGFRNVGLLSQSSLPKYTPADFGGTIAKNNYDPNQSPFWTSEFTYMITNVLYNVGEYYFMKETPDKGGLTFKANTPEGGASYSFGAGGPAEIFAYNFTANPDLPGGATLIPIPAP